MQVICTVSICSFEMRSKYGFVYWPCQHGTFSLRDRGDASARQEKGPLYQRCSIYVTS
jgi:hypothetical protein